MKYLGIDLGVINTATDSDGEFYSTRNESIESIAKRIAYKAFNTNRAIALENLSVLMLPGWNHKSDSDAVFTACNEMGVPYETVWPAYTSIVCYRCRALHAANRSGLKFKCARCGHRDHADINAAKNISYRAEFGITYEKVRNSTLSTIYIPRIATHRIGKIFTGGFKLGPNIVIPKFIRTKRVQSGATRCFVDAMGGELKISRHIDHLVTKYNLRFPPESITGPAEVLIMLENNGYAFNARKNKFNSVSSNQITASTPPLQKLIQALPECSASARRWETVSE